MLAKTENFAGKSRISSLPTARTKKKKRVSDTGRYEKPDSYKEVSEVCVAALKARRHQQFIIAA